MITDSDISEEHSVCMLQDYFVDYLNKLLQNEYVGISSLSSEMKVYYRVYERVSSLELPRGESLSSFHPTCAPET